MSLSLDDLFCTYSICSQQQNCVLYSKGFSVKIDYYQLTWWTCIIFLTKWLNVIQIKCEWKMKSRDTVTLKYQKLYPTNLETCLQSISLDRKKVWKSSLQPTYKPHVHQIPLIICVCTNTDIAPTDSQICNQLNQSINRLKIGKATCDCYLD